MAAKKMLAQLRGQIGARATADRDGQGAGKITVVIEKTEVEKQSRRRNHFCSSMHLRAFWVLSSRILMQAAQAG